MKVCVSIDTSDLFLLGDVHGRFDRVERVLAHAGLSDGIPPSVTLVQVGDLVDRGREDERLPERLAAAELPDKEMSVPDPNQAEVPVSLRAILEGNVPWEAELLHRERVALLGAIDTLATLRGFMKLEGDHPGRVHCLLGNHDLDLLVGGYYYLPRQKCHLLALLGMPSARIAFHAREKLPLSEISAAAPELAWLARRPLLAVGSGVVAVHGGPTHSLMARLDALGIDRLEGLDAWLGEAWQTAHEHEAFLEGSSLLSPDGPEDDVVADATLRAAFLRLTGAELMAVGHSAFLHARKGQRVHAADPRLGPPIEFPAFLAQGQVLKLDTGAKRGGPVWLVERRSNCWRAIREDGRALNLA